MCRGKKFTKRLVGTVIQLSCQFVLIFGQPIITGVTPIFGSPFGGTMLTITGTQFMPAGMLSSVMVMIGQDECQLVPNCVQNQCSNNEKIVCVTSQCSSLRCKQDIQYQNMIDVYYPGCGMPSGYSNSYSVTVYAQISASSGFAQATRGQFGTSSFAMPRITGVGSPYTWSTSTNYISFNSKAPDWFFSWVGTSAVSCSTFSLTINRYNADLGLINNELNTDPCNDKIFYRPPFDSKAGFYDVQLTGTSTSGFPSGLAHISFAPFSTLKTNYTTAIFPVITGVSPKFGSIGGGQSLTITGNGFSRNLSDLLVYVAGVPCNVISSTASQLKCVTGTSFNSSQGIKERRKYGSVGWFVKLWAFEDATQGHVGFDEYSRLRLPRRGDFGLNFQNENGLRNPPIMRSFYDSPIQMCSSKNSVPQNNTSWEKLLNVSGSGNNTMCGICLTADGGAIFVAPLSGSYVFTLAADSVGYLYISHQDIYINETLIISAAGGHKNSSKTYHFQASERIFLRFRCIFHRTTDKISVGVKITPSSPLAQRRTQESVGKNTEKKHQQHYDERLRRARKLKSALPHMFPASAEKMAARQAFRWNEAPNETFSERISHASPSNIDGRRVLTNSQPTLEYDLIPMWMLENSLSFASSAANLTVAEVYVHTDSGDVMKAICDGAADIGYPKPAANFSINRLFAYFQSHSKGSENDCAYRYEKELTPFIFSYNISKTAESNHVYVVFVDVFGENFLVGGTTSTGSISNSLKVTIAGEICLIMKATNTYIYCNISTAPYGQHQVLVSIVGIGNAVNLATTLLSFPVKILGFSPLSASFLGNIPLSVWGYGFSPNSSVLIGQSNCQIMQASAQLLICLIPKCAPVSQITSVSAASFRVSVNNYVYNGSFFSYNTSLTPKITSITPSNISTAITTLIHVTGQGFLDITGKNNTASCIIGGSVCSINSVFDDQLTCILKKNLTTQPVVQSEFVLTIYGKGAASLSSNTFETPTVLMGFEVYDIHPKSGSYYGGTTLSIAGFGFSAGYPELHSLQFTVNSAVANYISLAHYLGVSDSAASPYILECDAKSATFFSIICTLEYYLFRNPQGDDVAADTVLVPDFELNTATAFVASTFSYSLLSSSTPTLKSIKNIQTHLGITKFTLTGSGFISNPPFAPVINLMQNSISYSCSVSEYSANQTGVICSNIAAGSYDVFLLARGKGYALTHLQVTILLNITSVTSSSRSTSLGGGAFFHIHGAGFDTNCSGNSVAFAAVVGGKTVLLNVNNKELINCTATEISGFLPSTYNLINSQSLFASQVVSIQSTSISVGGLTATKHLTNLDSSLLYTPIVEKFTPHNGTGTTKLQFVLHITTEPTLHQTVKATEAGRATPSQAPTVISTARVTSDTTLHQTVEGTTAKNTAPSREPTMIPTAHISFEPTLHQTVERTRAENVAPSHAPTIVITSEPTLHLTVELSAAPSQAPNMTPAAHATSESTSPQRVAPTRTESSAPSQASTTSPTAPVTAVPTFYQTLEPTRVESVAPSQAPPASSTAHVTSKPTLHQTGKPTKAESVAPSMNPTELFRSNPIVHQTVEPPRAETASPSQAPTISPAALLPSSFAFVKAGDYDLPCIFFTLSGGKVEVHCTVINLPANNYSLFINIPPFGNALEQSHGGLQLPVFTSLLKVASLNTAFTSSIAGGGVLSFSGQGLSSPSLQINVCDLTCDISSSSFESVTCAVPARLTFTSNRWGFINQTSNFSALNTISIEYPVSIMSSTANLFDSNFATVFAPFGQYWPIVWQDCNIWPGIQLASGYAVQPTRMGFFPGSDLSLYPWWVYWTINFEGLSYRTGQWVVLGSMQFTRPSTSKWFYIDAISNLARGLYTALRYRHPQKGWGACYLSEVVFNGFVASVVDVCPITFSGVPLSVEMPVSVGNVSYALQSASPFVSMLSPTNGTSLGGTSVTLFGSYFLSSLDITSSPTVYLNGILCSVTDFTATWIDCVTGARTYEQIQPHSIDVRVAGKGLAVINDGIYFLYVDKWSRLTTWQNQDPPVDGDVVWVPVGQSLLLDVDSPKLEFLLIEGEMYLDKTKSSLKLDSNYIYVHGGKLEIGTADEPYNSQVTITLHGDRYTTIELPLMGAKCISASGLHIPNSLTFTDPAKSIPEENVATLSIHGKKRLRSWTKLNSTAYAGDTFFITAENVDFTPGEIVVLSGSQLWDHHNSSQVQTQSQATNSGGQEDFSIDEVVVAANIDGYRIQITTPLRFTHFSEIRVVEGRVLDLRCEVALLSRNIVIQGDEITDQEQFGVITAAFLGGVVYRIQDIEMKGCGQAFNLGRYCLHAHMSGNMAGSYVKSTVVHDSFNRAIIVHATNYFEVRDNVVYNIMGNAIFIELGNELYNTFSGNLGIYIRKSSALLISDLGPSVFWSATPANFWYDNVCVNSEGHGFWFQSNSQSPVGLFQNNTFRANGDNGIRFYPAYTPSQFTTLRGLLIYRNGGEGLFAMGLSNLQVRETVFMENGEYDVALVGTGPQNVPLFDNCLFIGRLDPASNHTQLGIKLPQAEGFLMNGITFLNYVSSGAISNCFKCDSCYSSYGGFTYRTQNLKFINTKSRISWDLWGDVYHITGVFAKDMYLDLDGTLLGQRGAMLAKHFPHLSGAAGCFLADASTYSDSIICQNTTTIRTLVVSNTLPDQVTGLPIVVKSLDTGAIGAFMYFLKVWNFPVVNQGKYLLNWPTSTVRYFVIDYTKTFDLQFSHIQKESIVLALSTIHGDYDPYSFAITTSSSTLWSSRTTMVDQFHDPNGASYFNSSSASQTVYVLASTTGADRTKPTINLQVQSKLCPPNGCPAPPKPQLHSMKLWSNKNTWAGHNYSDPGFPCAGCTVTIKANEWIGLDISTPKLGCVIVFGKLSFVSNTTTPITLTALCIEVFGVLEIVGPNKTAFEGAAAVNLYGARATSVAPVMGEGIYAGAKVIEVAGQLTAIGRQVFRSWTKLASTAQLGDNFVLVPKNTSWAVGSEIAISGTSYFNQLGSFWDDVNSPANEIRVVTAVSVTFLSNLNCFVTKLTLNEPLKWTHDCFVSVGEEFCGYVGLLTRSVVFYSSDIDQPAQNVTGFGGHIAVVDWYDPATLALQDNADPVYSGSTLVGSIYLDSVQFRDFGQANNDQYTIGFLFRNDYSKNPSLFGNITQYISNCAFIHSHNIVVYADPYVFSLTVSNNVMINSNAGNIYIGPTCRKLIVSKNLAMSTFQVAAYQESCYYGVCQTRIQTLGMFVFGSVNKASYFGNVATGSFDAGFIVAGAVFAASVPAAACFAPPMQPYRNDEILKQVLQSKIFYDNEAVACRKGMFVKMWPSTPSCMLVRHFKGWRNANFGLFVNDAVNIVVSNVVLAENAIGLTWNHVLDTTIAAGVLRRSKVIGSLSDKMCFTQSEPNKATPYATNWLALKCSSFPLDNDTPGTRHCGGLLGSSAFTRIGFVLPINGRVPRTKGNSPYVRWGFNRPCNYNGFLEGYSFGYPSFSVGYLESHVVDTLFTGFSANPACASSFGVAMQPNPSEQDEFPPYIMSNITWLGEATGRMDVDSRLNTASAIPFLFLDKGNAILNVTLSENHTDNQVMVVSNADPNTILTPPSDPNVCYPSLKGTAYVCPLQASFNQYPAVWRDTQNVATGPLVVTRFPQLSVVGRRSYLTENTPNTLDICPEGPREDPYNRYPFYVVAGQHQKIELTGTLPLSFSIRWNAPSSDDSAVLTIGIAQNHLFNVFVGQELGQLQHILGNDFHIPTLDDPLGTNAYNSFYRNMSVTLRGGPSNYIEFRAVPFVQVTIGLDMSITNFFSGSFIANIATLLHIPRNRIKIVRVSPGSVYVDFIALPNNTVAQNMNDSVAQVSELKSLAEMIHTAAQSGDISKQLNASVLAINVTLPPPPQPFVGEVVAMFSGAVTRNITVNRTVSTGSPTSLPTTRTTLSTTAQKTAAPTEVRTAQPESLTTTQPTATQNRSPNRSSTVQNTAAPSGSPTSSPETLTNRHTSAPSSSGSLNQQFNPTSSGSLNQQFNPSYAPSKQPTKVPQSTHLPSRAEAQANSPMTQSTAAPKRSGSLNQQLNPSYAPSKQPTKTPQSAHPSKTSSPVSRSADPKSFELTLNASFTIQGVDIVFALTNPNFTAVIKKALAVIIPQLKSASIAIRYESVDRDRRLILGRLVSVHVNIFFPNVTAVGFHTTTAASAVFFQDFQTAFSGSLQAVLQSFSQYLVSPGSNIRDIVVCCGRIDIYDRNGQMIPPLINEDQAAPSKSSTVTVGILALFSSALVVTGVFFVF